MATQSAGTPHARSSGGHSAMWRRMPACGGAAQLALHASASKRCTSKSSRNSARAAPRSAAQHGAKHGAEQTSTPPIASAASPATPFAAPPSPPLHWGGRRTGSAPHAALAAKDSDHPRGAAGAAAGARARFAGGSVATLDRLAPKVSASSATFKLLCTGARAGAGAYLGAGAAAAGSACSSRHSVESSCASDGRGRGAAAVAAAAAAAVVAAVAAALAGGCTGRPASAAAKGAAVALATASLLCSACKVIFLSTSKTFLISSTLNCVLSAVADPGPG
eukprot:scaffold89324_cov63-Phaeocystis_antarctica.AAC.1